MKCPNCGTDSKLNIKFCKKCGADMSLPPAWMPGWKWHVKTLATIYIILIAVFFTAKHFLGRLPQPYNIRTLPTEMTPWLYPHNNPAP